MAWQTLDEEGATTTCLLVSVTDRSTEPEGPRPRSIVVTGASDGIGREAVRAFANAGDRVVMVGRNEAKTAAAARTLMSETGSRAIEWEIADLSRQDAIRELAKRLRTRMPSIDVLINNAGALFLDRECTAEGLERTFALNHLAYFSLSLLLVDSLAAAATAGHPSRILCVSSRAHREARLVLDDLQMANGYSGWRAYANSKFANLLFARALARRLSPASIVVHALHPGLVSTRFAVGNGLRGRMLRRLMDLMSITPAQGADTMVWLASAPVPAQTTGEYWVKRTAVAPRADALDDALADALWQRSADLANLDADAMIARSGAGRLSAAQMEHR